MTTAYRELVQELIDQGYDENSAYDKADELNARGVNLAAVSPLTLQAVGISPTSGGQVRPSQSEWTQSNDGVMGQTIWTNNNTGEVSYTAPQDAFAGQTVVKANDGRYYAVDADGNAQMIAGSDDAYRAMGAPPLATGDAAAQAVAPLNANLERLKGQEGLGNQLKDFASVAGPFALAAGGANLISSGALSGLFGSSPVAATDPALQAMLEGYQSGAAITPSMGTNVANYAGVLNDAGTALIPGSGPAAGAIATEGGAALPSWLGPVGSAAGGAAALANAGGGSDSSPLAWTVQPPTPMPTITPSGGAPLPSTDSWDFNPPPYVPPTPGADSWNFNPVPLPPNIDVNGGPDPGIPVDPNTGQPYPATPPQGEPGGLPPTYVPPVSPGYPGTGDPGLPTGWDAFKKSLPEPVQKVLDSIGPKELAGIAGALMGATQGQPAPITTTVTPWGPAQAGMQAGLDAAQAQLAKSGSFNAPAVPTVPTYGNTYNAPEVPTAPTYENPYVAPTTPTLDKYGNPYKAPAAPTIPTYANPYTAPNIAAPTQYGNTYQDPNVFVAPQYDTAYTDKYLADAIQGAIRPLEDQFQNVVMPQIGSSAQGNGQFGSSRQAIAEAIAARKLAQTTGDVSSQLMNQFAQSRAANILGTNTLNSSNITNINQILAQIAAARSAGAQGSNALTSAEKLNTNSLQAQIAQAMAQSGLSTNELNSRNTLGLYNTATTNAQNEAAAGLSTNELNSRNQLSLFGTEAQIAAQRANAGLDTNRLNSSNLWAKTNANITNAANTSTGQNNANALNNSNLWADYAARYKTASDQYTMPWNALTAANNIFSQAGGIARTTNTPLPETPWWQTALAGGGAAYTAAQKLFPGA